MPHVRHRLSHWAAAVVAGLVAMPVAWAQSYPDRPVRMIVAFAPGGPTDIVGRLIAQKLSDRLGQQFYVENIGGGGGNIGTARAAQATPDGYTVLFAANTIAINPSLYGKVSYDLEKDFDPVSLAVSSASLLTVHASVPAQSVKDLVALIGSNPGKYSYATPGVGTPPHLLGELLRLSYKLDLVHVPFNGGGLAIASTIAGHTPISFGAAAPALPHIKDGKLRALAVTTRSRTPTLPDVPTMAEAGYPGIVGEAWFGLLAPAGTAKPIVARLHREIVAVMALPDVRERVAVLGFDPVANSPEEFAEKMKADAEKWGKVIRDAGITPR